MLSERFLMPRTDETARAGLERARLGIGARRWAVNVSGLLWMARPELDNDLPK